MSSFEPRTQRIEHYPLSDERDAYVALMTRTRDGKLWIQDEHYSWLYQFDPKTHRVDGMLMPIRPGGIAAGQGPAIWATKSEVTSTTLVYRDDGTAYGVSTFASELTRIVPSGRARG